MLKIALIGAGRIGKVHAANIAHHGRAELSAVFDVDQHAAESLAAKYGAKAQQDLDAALDDADAAMICSSTDTHVEMIRRAAEKNKAIFCEKPIDLDMAKVNACLDDVKKAGVPLMIGFNRRFDPHFRALKDALSRGEIGKLEVLRITSRDPEPPPPAYVAVSGGIFRDMMIHDFDMARFLLAEEPVQVFAVGSALVDPEIGKAGDVDTAAVTLTTASGRICQISNSRRAIYGYDQRVEVHGARGLLRAENHLENSVEVATGAGFRRAPAQNFFLERYEAAYLAEMRHFVEAVLSGKSPKPGIEDGLRAQMLADAAAMSLETGLPVRP